jgi:hypothetical protein
MKKFLNDLLGQAWTLLGMFVAWVVLEGCAKTIVGYCIIGTLSLWVATYPLRNSAEKEEEPKDGDDDGLVYDGTPKERKVKAAPKAKKTTK